MVSQATLLTELQTIAGAENVRPGQRRVRGRRRYARGGSFGPATAEAAAAVIRHANAEKLAVIPVGGEQRAGPGNVPARYDIALDVSGLSAIVDYEPEDLTITCGASMTLGALREATAAAGQMVPFDPDISGEATIGGGLAADLWGPSRLSLGGPRDFTIGLRVITGDGLITRAGGRVVKNVAGYDLCKLYVGSLGTLAVITEANVQSAAPAEGDPRSRLRVRVGSRCVRHRQRGADARPQPALRRDHPRRRGLAAGRHARRIGGSGRAFDAGARFVGGRPETGDGR